MPLPMMVPATMAMQCHAFSSRTSSRLFGIGLQQTCEIAYNESSHRAHGYVPGEGDFGPAPYIDVEGQPAKHSDHGAGLPGAPGDDSQEEYTQQTAVGDGCDGKSGFQHFASTA